MPISLQHLSVYGTLSDFTSSNGISKQKEVWAIKQSFKYSRNISFYRAIYTLIFIAQFKDKYMDICDARIIFKIGHHLLPKYIDCDIWYINTSKLIKNDGNIRSLPFCRYLIIGFHAHAPKSQSAVLRNTWILHKHYCPLKRSWGVKPKILAMFVFHCYSCKSNIFPVARWLLCGQGSYCPREFLNNVVVLL